MTLVAKGEKAGPAMAPGGKENSTEASAPHALSPSNGAAQKSDQRERIRVARSRFLPPPVTPRELRWLLILLAAATVLRLGFLAAFSHVEPVGDQLAYLKEARNFLQGEAYIGTRGPAYSALLAAAYRAAGDLVPSGQFLAAGTADQKTVTDSAADPLLHAIFRVGQGLNLVLSLILLWFVWLVGRQSFTPRTALIAVAFLALYPRYATLPLYLFSEHLYTLCVAVGIYFLCRSLRSGGALACVAAGLIFGVGILTREMMLYFIPVCGAAFLLLAPEGLFGAARRTFILGAAAVLVVAPWTLRNYQLYKQFVLVGFAEGIPLFEGNFRFPDRDPMAPGIIADIRAERRERFKAYAQDYRDAHASETGDLVTSSKIYANTKIKRDAYGEIFKRWGQFYWGCVPAWPVDKFRENFAMLLQPGAQYPVIWGYIPPDQPRLYGQAMIAFFMLGSALVLLLAPFGLSQWRIFSTESFLVGHVLFSFLIHLTANAGPPRFQHPYEWVFALWVARLWGQKFSWNPFRILCGLLLIGVVATSQQTERMRWQKLVQELTAASEIGTSVTPVALDAKTIRVSWGAPETHKDKVAYYLLQYSRAPQGAWEQIDERIQGPEYTLTGLSKKTTYNFRVKSADLEANRSGWSAIAQGTTFDRREIPVTELRPINGRILDGDASLLAKDDQLLVRVEPVPSPEGFEASVDLLAVVPQGTARLQFIGWLDASEKIAVSFDTYDRQSPGWVEVGHMTLPGTDARRKTFTVDQDLARFVDPYGRLRARIVADSQSKSFELRLDQCVWVVDAPPATTEEEDLLEE